MPLTLVYCPIHVFWPSFSKDIETDQIGGKKIKRKKMIGKKKRSIYVIVIYRWCTNYLGQNLGKVH